MLTTGQEIQEAFRQGIIACRKEKWREGMDLLTQVAQAAERRGNLPAVFYSYLGVCLARCEGRKRDGLELCRYAVRVDPSTAESYLNLATVYLMLGRRQAAVREIFRGLAIHPGHSRLEELHDSVGRRRPPLLPFLTRDNPLNSLAGRLRARWEARRERREERREEAELLGA